MIMSSTLETMAQPEVLFKPQPGQQEAFMASPADITIFGGGAFGGKSFVTLLEAARNTDLPGFKAVIFRRTYPMIFNPGGLWDTCEQIYPYLGASPRMSDCEWRFPSGSSVLLSHLQHEKDKLNYQGAALPFIAFDELTHFSSSVFWYLVSRNRLDRPMPLRPYMRATCNPDNNSWVYKELIWWWINDKTGLPIMERSGVLRYFVRVDNRLVWGDSPAEVVEAAGCPLSDVKSLTFIPARATDNPIGMRNDPGYLANLRSLPLFEREQLLNGNWKVKPSAGMRFRREWFKIISKDEALTMMAAHQDGPSVRYYDRASTEPNATNADPDGTAGVKMTKLGKRAPFRYLVNDCRFWKRRPSDIMANIATTAAQDRSPDDCELCLERDPGSAGIAERDNLADYLAAYAPNFVTPTGSKWVRSAPFSAAAENHLVAIVEGSWNEAYLDELEDFCDEKALAAGQKMPHDDRVDGSSGSFNRLAKRGTPGIN